MRISDQAAAIKLAICDDIGERSYDVIDVAAILVQMLTRHPEVGRSLSDCKHIVPYVYLIHSSKTIPVFLLSYRTSYSIAEVWFNRFRQTLQAI